MLMLLQMAVKVGLLTEAAVAQVTFEGLLLVVDIADVPLKIGWDAEWAVTVFTPARVEKNDVNAAEQECPSENSRVVSMLLRLANILFSRSISKVLDKNILFI